MNIDYTTFSETGKRRANQDAFCVIRMPDCNRTLMVVCDGIGGHPLGDIAADTVCNTICEFWKNNCNDPDTETKVMEACKAASDAVYNCSRAINPIGMGSTMVMASIEGNYITIAHCGDSRCYLFRNGEVIYQTQDHADSQCGSEILTKCFFATAPEVAVPDIARFELQSGDRIFICSDGVYKSMAPHILAERVQDKNHIEDVIDVIKFMCEKYSTDNYTGILAVVE